MTDPTQLDAGLDPSTGPTTGRARGVTAQDLEDLRGRVRGQVYGPADEGYDVARAVWNGMINRRPAVVVSCSGASDVAHAVRFARAHGLPVAVKGGGHNVSGSAVRDGAVALDLSPMRHVRVDPVRQVVRAGGGALLGDIDHETHAFGLAVPMGLVSATGVGGLSLHGGLGAMTRKHGLTCDQLVAADVVTADGEILTVDETSHPDLLWALKGGGGGFGVVTSFELRAFPIGPEVWLGLTMYPAAKALPVLRRFRELMATAPDEVMGVALFWNSPEDESIPEGARGVPVIILAAWHTGTFDEGEEAVRPFREADTPLVDLSGPVPYLEVQQLFDPDYPNGRRYYWKSTYLESLDDDVIEVLGEHAARRPSPISSVDVWALGGAMERVAPGDTAFAQRDAPFLLGIEANWDDPARDEENLAWARELHRAAEPFSAGTYLNFPGFVEEADTAAAAFGSNVERLREIKRRYDPEGMFPGTVDLLAGV